jgi:hypothetical protein
MLSPVLGLRQPRIGIRTDKEGIVAKSDIFILEEDGPFIDESGKTSLEPEGVGHPKGGSGTDEEGDRFRGNEDDQETVIDRERGMPPVEGDGEGAPS